MARTWNERKFGYFNVQDKSDELKPDGNTLKTSPASGIMNFHRAITPNSGTRGKFMRSTPPPSGIQNIYRSSTPNSALRGNLRKGQSLLSWITSAVICVFDVFRNFLIFHVSFLLSRNITRQFFMVCLPCGFLILVWKHGNFTKLFTDSQESQNIEVLLENDMSLENGGADKNNYKPTQLWHEMEKKLHVALENKWQEMSKQLENKWINKFQHVERWQKEVSLKIKDIELDSKATTKEVINLKLTLQSRLRDDKMNESSTHENFKNVLFRLNQVEMKSKGLEDMLLGHKNWCKSQADQNIQLLSLVQEIQANFSQVLHLKNSIDSSCDQTGIAPNLQEIMEIIEVTLHRYNSDKTGLVDYALESAGASIVRVRDTETYSHGTTQFTLFGIPFWRSKNSPRAVIQPQVHPGECWAMRGSSGKLVIRLFANIQPTGFSLEHIPKSLAPMGNIDSAPKDFSVFGLKSDYDEDGFLLGNYTYLDSGKSLQTFYVQNPQDATFILIELRLHSNHGNLDYTCIYRFRVHGIQK